MKTHAVPHEIMSVEFKLFGNFLSLREFIYIAIGVALAYLFYFLMQNGILPGILAFPAIFCFGLGGAMIGLLPIQDKSLDQWIVNFLVAIRRPTQRVWKKEGYRQQQKSTDKADPATNQFVTKDHLVTPPTQPSAASLVDGALKTTPLNDSFTVSAEKDEMSDLAEIDKTLGQMEEKVPQQPITQEKISVAPSAVTVSLQPVQATPVTGKTHITPQSPIQVPTQMATVQNLTNPAQKMPLSNRSASATSKTTTPAVQKPVAPPSPAGSAPPQPVPPGKGVPEETAGDPSRPSTHVITIDDNNLNNYATSITSLESKANTINIVVKDANGLILPGVVCVIKNAHGDPVRAAISNILGQILNNVPLKSSTYRIILTKQGYVFPELVRSLHGKIYPPIEIRSL